MIKLVVLCFLATLVNSYSWSCGPCRCTSRRGETKAHCQNRQLKSVPVELPNNLTTLFLQDNYIRSTVQLSSQINAFKNLQTLKLYNNKLSSVPQLTLNKLKQLDLSLNNIEGLQNPLNLPQLQELDISKNVLNSISPKAFTNLINLQFLHLTNNALQSFSLTSISTLTQLSVLDLSYNHLSKIIISSDNEISLPSLKTLQLSHNNLGYQLTPTTFSSILNTMPSLRVFKISNNKLEKLPLQLNSASSSTGSSLSIDASSNQIDWLSKSDLGTESHRISKLDLRHNRLQGVQYGAFQNMDENVNIFLDDNKWHCCHSKYLFEWLVDRTSRSRFVSSDGINRNLQCLTSNLQLVPMNEESVEGETCFAHQQYIKTDTQTKTGEIYFQLQNQKTLPEYSHWNISIQDSDDEEQDFQYITLSTSNSLEAIEVLKSKSYKICFGFSEQRPYLSCETIYLKSNHDQPTTKKPTSMQSKPEDEVSTWLAIVTGVLAVVIILSGVLCLRLLKRGGSESEEFNKQPHTLGKIVGGGSEPFLNHSDNSWLHNPLDMSRRHPENFPPGTINMPRTIIRHPTSQHVDARNEFDVTLVNPSGDLIRPGGFGDNQYTAIIRTKAQDYYGGRNPSESSPNSHLNGGHNDSSHFRPIPANTESSHLSDGTSDYV